MAKKKKASKKKAKKSRRRCELVATSLGSNASKLHLNPRVAICRQLLTKLLQKNSSAREFFFVIV